MSTFYEFTNEEKEVLKIVLNSPLICHDGCVFEDMENSKKTCDECRLTLITNKLLRKLE